MPGNNNSLLTDKIVFPEARQVRTTNIRIFSSVNGYQDNNDALDPSDLSLEDTALRETYEEVGIPPSAIDMLGSYSPLPNYNGSLRVHPFVGFVRNPPDTENLSFNTEEVSHVFTLPLEYLARDDVREMRNFRGTPYKYTVFKVPPHIEGEGEIWGLTSFILDGKFVSLIPSRLKRLPHLKHL